MSMVIHARALAAPAPSLKPAIEPLTATASLLTEGALLGISTNLAKLAGMRGISPLAYLFWSLLGTSQPELLFQRLPCSGCRWRIWAPSFLPPFSRYCWRIR